MAGSHITFTCDPRCLTSVIYGNHNDRFDSFY